AGLGRSGGEAPAGGGPGEEPFARVCARAPGTGPGAAPLVVHGVAERSRGSVARQPPRLARDFRERETDPAELPRDGHPQVASRLQFVEIFLAEAIVAVVAGGAPATGLE